MGLDGGPRSASVEAVEKSLCARIPRFLIEQHLRDDPTFAMELLKLVIRRARSATEALQTVALTDVWGRLRPALEALAVRQADGTWLIDPAPSYRDLGKQLVCAHTAIASGHVADAILRLSSGEVLGTLLVANTPPLAARKQWLADHLQLAGRLVLDDGAVQALGQGKSLLPIGVVSVEGDFERGAAVACLTPDGQEVARGLANYGSGEARLIARKASGDIEGILGYVDEPELIHRDNLILLG